MSRRTSGTMNSLLNLGSAAQSKKKRSKPMTSNRAAGIPSTIRGVAAGASLTVLVWHTAQLRNARSIPM